MNYIVSSIILLSVVLVIIYMLSIDNNGEKMYNKLKELVSVIKSKKINYTTEKDNINLLNYIMTQFKDYNNIIIPTRIYYDKKANEYIMKDINIICYKNSVEFPYTITITFTPINMENYISSQSLFGLQGHFNMTITSPVQTELDTDVFNMIPDVIHLSENTDTTDSIALITHNLK